MKFISIVVPALLLCSAALSQATSISSSTAREYVLYAKSVASSQGQRSSMEDFYTIEQNKKCAFFAVYDGHGGKEVARYASRQLHQRIFEHKDFEVDVQKAIVEAFVAFHKELDDLGSDEDGNTLAEHQGTTVALALIKSGYLYIAWAGDSRCILVSQDGFTSTVDHTYWIKAEADRIKQNGGQIRNGRILIFKTQGIGSLAMTRALGDKFYSPVGVIPTPEIQMHKLTATDQFLLLATDGIWDVFNNQEAVQIVRDELKENGIHETAQKLISKSEGSVLSADNKTVIVVSLSDLGPICDESDCDTIAPPFSFSDLDDSTVDSDDEKSQL